LLVICVDALPCGIAVYAAAATLRQCVVVDSETCCVDRQVERELQKAKDEELKMKQQQQQQRQAQLSRQRQVLNTSDGSV